jgi:two-component system chemotaxis sensor kinase CheA
VDKVLGDCQTVIKNLGRVYRHVQVVSGATILGNGSVALIVDPERLVQEVVRSLAHGVRGRPLGAGRGREGLQSQSTTPADGPGHGDRARSR